MNIRENTFYLCIYELILLTLTCILNSYVLVHFFKHRSHKVNDFTMLLIKAIFEVITAVLNGIYCIFVLLKLYDVVENPNILYFFGIKTMSCFSTLGLLTLFVSLDRLVAMRRPVRYKKLYSSKLQKVTLYAIGASSVGLFLSLALTKRSDVAEEFLSSQIWSQAVANVAENFTIIGFAASTIVTIVFQMEFRRFMKNRSRSMRGTVVENIKLVNKIVLVQMIAEVVLLVIPKITEFIVQIVTGMPISAFVGLIHLPLFTTYIFLCALLFCVLSARKHQTSTISPVNNFSSNVAF